MYQTYYGVHFITTNYRDPSTGIKDCPEATELEIIGNIYANPELLKQPSYLEEEEQ